MNILMVTPESVPYAKTGGLADMVGALSASLKNKGADVRIFMPRYYSINPGSLKKLESALSVPMPYGDEWAAVYKSPETSEVPYYFLEHEQLFGRDGIYGYTPDKAFDDNAKRYSFFCRAVFNFCRMINWIPDVIHCHDWAAALVPFILRKEEFLNEFSGTFSILTIHNLGYQGIFPMSDAYVVKKYLSQYELSELEFDGAMNFLKTGILNADTLTTVSPTYAKEIQSPEYGYRLDYLLRIRSNDLYGIINGADYEAWNPGTDHYIAPNNYTVSKIGGKKKVKAAFQKEFDLPVDSSVPLFSIVSRLVSQKGLIELCAPGWGSLYSICNDFNLQFVIVGSGEKWCEDELRNLASRLPNLKLWIGYNERISHLAEAGSDFFLMPSRYEPSGLNQMYSMRYGTLPIVRNTGGLSDTVENYNESTGEGTGFVFNNLTPESIYNTVGWALSAWYNKPKDIEKMQRNAMKKDFSWDLSSEKYITLYKMLISRRDIFFGISKS